VQVVVVGGGGEEAGAGHCGKLSVEDLGVIGRAGGEGERAHPARTTGLYTEADAAIGTAE
jgi:hypothetical protein